MSIIRGLTPDYDIYNPSLGIEYKFSPTLVGTLQGGYFWQFADDDSETRGPFFHVGLAQTGQKTSYILAVDGGYTQDYFTSENLGFEKYYMGYGTINHRLTQRLSIQAVGSAERVWYPAEDDNRKDWIWEGRLGASYLLSRWLTISLVGRYREARSTTPGLDYTEYAGIFTITLARPGYQPGTMWPGFQRGMIGQPTY